MHAITKYIILYIGMIVVCGLAGFICDYFISGMNGEPMGTWTSTIGGILYLLFVIYTLFQFSDGKKMFKTTSKKKDKNEKKQFYDSDWLTEAELNKKYIYSTFRDLYKTQDGPILRAERSGHNIKVNMVDKTWHGMVVGTTGSGKTAGFVSPCMQILSSTKTKPCFVVNDMKGEIYEMHAKKLRDEGYRIKVLDLRDAYASTRWNPMARPYRLYQRSLHLLREVKVHRNQNPADLGLQILAPVYNNEWYEFEGRAYPTRVLLDNDLTALKKKLYDEAYEDLNDIATTLCPIQSQSDPTWERGAKDFILGTMLAMLEDSAYPELGMTEEKFNFFNLYKIANIRDSDPDRQFATLQKYFQGRPKLSVAASLAGPIVNNAPLTARSFFGVVAQYTGMFADAGICFTTSADEMDFSDFADQPTALFIKVPDEKETRHTIATMCILQLYKTLVDVANHRPGRTLPRRVYFMLDEFGNLPKIPKLESIITVGRSRNICMILIVQNYTQIEIKYGEAIANTLKSNCNIHYFIGTTDQKTKEEFSTRCGHTSVDSVSTTESKAKDGSQKSTSTSKASAPLIHPDELSLLKEGEFIISMYGEKAYRSTFTFAYKCKDIYDMTPTPEEYAPARFIDEDKMYYDIKERNRKIFR